MSGGIGGAVNGGAVIFSEFLVWNQDTGQDRCSPTADVEKLR